MTVLSSIKNERVLNIGGVINFRDLGGYHTDDGRTVKWGQVYRSAQLDRMTEQGIIDMAAMSIKAVVDLRFTDETKKYPTILAAVPEAEILSWHDELTLENQSDHSGDVTAKSNDIQRSWKDSLDTNDPDQVREAMRVNYPKKLYSHRAIYRSMLLRLSTGKLPLVFHCAAGKDRTGVGAALILSLLGVSDEQIVADYLLTQNEIQHLLETWVAGGAGDIDDPDDFQKKLATYPRHIIQPVFDADELYIQTLLKYVKQNYGSFTEYAFQVLSLTETDIENIQNQLLIQE